MITKDIHSVVADITSASLASISMNSDPKSFLVRFRPELSAKFTAMCRDRKLTKTEAINAMVQWIVDQPPEMQAIVLGIIPGNVIISERRFGSDERKKAARRTGQQEGPRS